MVSVSLSSKKRGTLHNKKYCNHTNNEKVHLCGHQKENIVLLNEILFNFKLRQSDRLHSKILQIKYFA